MPIKKPHPLYNRTVQIYINIGANNQKMRSHQITKAAVTMQYLFRRWKQRNKAAVPALIAGMVNMTLDHKDQSTIQRDPHNYKKNDK